jgi:ADP-heptose:LPS heptosyltransferase
MNIHKINHIIIARIDALGDVILTLPLAGAIKKLNPNIKVSFLGRTYTKDIIACSKYVDDFINYDDIKNAPNIAEQANILNEAKADMILHIHPSEKLAQIAKHSNIKYRVATSHRKYHWTTCNKLLNIGRWRSKNHEAQVNLQFMRIFGQRKIVPLKQIPELYGTQLPDYIAADNRNELKKIIIPNKFNLIVGSKAKSAKEWGNDRYVELFKQLPQDKFNIIVTGIEKDRQEIEQQIIENVNQQNIINLIGKTSVTDLIYLVSIADGVLAGGTGVTHIGAMFGKYVVGLYPAKRFMHPRRWQPIGTKAHYLVNGPITCKNCDWSSPHCQCMRNISVSDVYNLLMAAM